MFAETSQMVLVRLCPPLSIVSLYVLTNNIISYHNFPSSLVDMSSNPRNSILTILLFLSFLAAVDRILGLAYLLCYYTRENV